MGGIATDPNASLSHLSRHEREAVRKMWAERELVRRRDFLAAVMAMSPSELMSGLSTSAATRRLEP
jgi:hypothetical protein